MNSALNEFFPEIVKGKRNDEVMSQTVASVFLRELVVEHLIWIRQNDPGAYWWKYEPLMKMFENMYKAQVISLPTDPVDRFRWIGMICLAVCDMEVVDVKEVVLKFDVLPDKLFGTVEGEDPKAAKEALEFRKNLAEKGWKEVFGW